MVRLVSEWVVLLLVTVSGLAAQNPNRLTLKITSLVLNDETIFDGLAKLSQVMPIGFSVERELTSKASPQLAAVVRFSTRIDGGTLQDSLDWLCKLDPRYEWLFAGGVVNVFPRQVEHDPSYPLNRTMSFFEIKDATSASAAALEAASHANPPQQIAILTLGNTDFQRASNLTFANVTLREALNRIAQTLGPTYGWQFSGTEDFHYLAFHDYLIPAPRPKPER